ncbi:hypothetical protein [Pediococcus ethanolidurans]|uniref:hypothetical protein n=1 Tax=Pediococcus ethanolidurans TaxID=319653 RepID=UPI001C1EF109|nr:hypothetical protein [Pediococcus ethanolidurans]MBU7555224.1 hypothetical protein [Pediococcus ethanolidurans]MBU7563505.1 hypothetical protein [Pediococcus ethanolidurans]MCT4398291.1 hypothetical protein [Pediococcus ethanolidurans]MCV3315734.1 hypothetical protein [Pediococcus ethanolidurans]MCV3321990.1 hypothetical protein [Pediococcus ethanolidurans]
MKKTTLLLLSSAFFLLGGCANNSNNSQSRNDETSSSVSKTSSSKKSSTVSETSSNQVVDSDNETTLLSSTWQFDKFTVHQIEAEIDDGQLEVKVEWQPNTEKRAAFSNFGQVKVTQNGQTLSSVEQDDDFDADEAIRDLDLTYRYQNKTNPVKIEISSADGEKHAVSFKLQ